jgi:cell division septal protein FtsQ
VRVHISRERERKNEVGFQQILKKTRTRTRTRTRTTRILIAVALLLLLLVLVVVLVLKIKNRAGKADRRVGGNSFRNDNLIILASYTINIIKLVSKCNN